MTYEKGQWVIAKEDHGYYDDASRIYTGGNKYQILAADYEADWFFVTGNPSNELIRLAFNKSGMNKIFKIPCMAAYDYAMKII